jgi:hypothetical protein
VLTFAEEQCLRTSGSPKYVLEPISKIVISGQFLKIKYSITTISNGQYYMHT